MSELKGLISFVSSGASSDATVSVLTEGDFERFVKQNTRYSGPRVLVVSRRESIVLDISGREDSWHSVRKPWRKRLASARGTVRYWWRERSEYEGPTLGYALRTVWRNLRQTTHTVWTLEARDEYEERIAGLGVVNRFPGVRSV